MTTDKNDQNFDLSIIIDQLSQDFNDEIYQVIFKDEEQCSDFDNAIDGFHDKMFDNMKTHDEEISIDQNMKKCYSDPNSLKFSSNDKKIEIDNSQQNENNSLDAQVFCSAKKHRYSKKEKVKDDFSEKGKKDSKSHNSSNTRIDINPVQYSDNFDNIFEPIHTEKSLMPINLCSTFKENARDKKTKNSTD